MLGQIALERSDIETAWTRYAECLALHERVGDVSESSWALGNLGLIAALRGDLATARRLLERGLALTPAAPFREPDLLARLAQVALGQGDVAEAAQLTARGLRLSVKMSSSFSIVRGVCVRAAIASVRGDAERALRLNAAALNVRDRAGWSLYPVDQRWLEGYLESARRRLDVTARERAEARGRAMTLEDVVADALADAPPEDAPAS
jgi:ATP/maltotriose-dependent transcriptional regulator MalT